MVAVVTGQLCLASDLHQVISVCSPDEVTGWKPRPQKPTLADDHVTEAAQQRPHARLHVHVLSHSPTS